MIIRDNCVELPKPLRSYSDEDRRAIGEELRKQSNEMAFSFFQGDATRDVGVVLFCGWGERFSTISVLAELDCPTLVVQDPYSPWFTGSSICAGFVEIEARIQGYLGHLRTIVFFGQSSGGYAALRSASRRGGSIAIAVSPQSFDDRSAKDRVKFPVNYSVDRTPEIDDFLDLHAEARENSRTFRCFIFVGASEEANPPNRHYWSDAIHWVRLIELENVSTFMLPISSQALMRKRSANFARLLKRAVEHAASPADQLVSSIEDWYFGMQSTPTYDPQPVSSVWHLLLDGQLCEYNPHTNVLDPCDSYSENTVFFVQRPSGSYVAFSASDGPFTFRPDGLVQKGAKVIREWEILTTSGGRATGPFGQPIFFYSHETKFSSTLQPLRMQFADSIWFSSVMRMAALMFSAEGL